MSGVDPEVPRVSARSLGGQVAIGVGAMGMTQALGTMLQLALYWASSGQVGVTNEQAGQLGVLLYPFFHYLLLRMGVVPVNGNGTTPEVNK